MGHLDNIGFINGVLTQQPATILSVEFDTLYFDSMGETKPDYLTSSLSWYVVSKPSWITVNPSSGSGSVNLQITAFSNFKGAFRTGTIQLSNNSTTIIINVEQDGVY